MNKTKKREFAKKLNGVITDMTKTETDFARRATEMGIGISDAAKIVAQLSHNSSMLAELHRELTKE